MKTVLVRTGKFRPDAVEVNRAKPDGIISSIAQLPDWLEEHCDDRRRRPDRDRARAPCAGALSAFRERCFTEAERAYCDSRPNPAQSYAGRFAGKEAVGKAIGFGVARAFAWRDIEIAGRPKPSVRLSGRVAAWAERVGAGSIDLSMTHSRELANAVAVVDRALMFQPLYTADEMRAAEQGHDVEAMMERAGRAVADAVLARYPEARRIAAVCGKGANGGDGKIALRLLAESGSKRANSSTAIPTLSSMRCSGPDFTASRAATRQR